MTRKKKGRKNAGNDVARSETPAKANTAKMIAKMTARGMATWMVIDDSKMAGFTQATQRLRHSAGEIKERTHTRTSENANWNPTYPLHDNLEGRFIYMYGVPTRVLSVSVSTGRKVKGSVGEFEGER
jgi:hypothetical protein